MITEIEIEGVGMYRLPNMWQEARVPGAHVSSESPKPVNTVPRQSSGRAFG